MWYRFFPPKHIRDVGTFQDAGPFVNDPLILALAEAAALFPLSEKPDFVISLGTGEPQTADISENVSDNTRQKRQKSIVRKLGEAFWEKLQDKQIREAIQTRCVPQWYHRLDTALDGFGPRLDDTASMPMLKEQAENDDSIAPQIERAACCLVASMFYFELDSVPDRHEGRFVGTGRILCSLPVTDKDFPKTMEKLSAESAQFLLDGNPICKVDDPSCFDKDGNLRKSIELNAFGTFAISLKTGQSEPWNISGSPFSVESLVKAQGLNMPFGRPDHLKRKASGGFDLPSTKRRCT